MIEPASYDGSLGLNACIARRAVAVDHVRTGARFACQPQGVGAAFGDFEGAACPHPAGRGGRVPREGPSLRVVPRRGRCVAIGQGDSGVAGRAVSEVVEGFSGGIVDGFRDGYVADIRQVAATEHHGETFVGQTGVSMGEFGVDDFMKQAAPSSEHMDASSKSSGESQS